MIDFFCRWRRFLFCVAPLFALLAACDNGVPKATPPTVTTYVSVKWEDLPVTSDEDLLAGFNTWYSACTRMANDKIWKTTCSAAAQVQPNAPAIREFLKSNLQVYSLRSADKGAKGLITGYFERSEEHTSELQSQP